MCELWRLPQIMEKSNLQKTRQYKILTIVDQYLKFLVSNILEKIIFNRTYGFIQINKTLTTSQNAYFKLRNTERAVLQLILEVLRSLNGKKGKKSGQFFCGLSKTFDSVNFIFHLLKVEYVEITEIPLQFVKSYFTIYSKKR